jgi:hypothetical protein
MKTPILIALSFICTCCPAQDLQTAPATLSAAGGRYVFGQVSAYRRDKYLLDTKTGRLWTIVSNTNGAELLEPVMYEVGPNAASLSPMSDDEELRLAADIKRKEKGGFTAPPEDLTSTTNQVTVPSSKP